MKMIYFNDSPNAKVVIGELTLTATSGGADGNLVNITIAEAGDESTVAVTVSGNDITVNIGTSNDQHANGIAAAMNLVPASLALCTASGGGTTAITAAVAQTFLVGGEAYFGYPISSFAGMQPVGNSLTQLYFKSMKNFDGHVQKADDEIVCDTVTLTLATANTHKDVMQAFCEAINSSSAGYGDLILGNDEAGSTNYFSSLVTSIAAVEVFDAN